MFTRTAIAFRSAVLLLLFLTIGVGEGWGQSAPVILGVSTTSGTGTTGTISRATLNAQTNDFLVLTIAGNAAIPNQTGWTSITPSQSSGSARIRSFYKLAGQNETGTSGTISITTASGSWVASVIRVGGNKIKVLNPAFSASNVNTGTSSNTPTAPTLTGLTGTGRLTLRTFGITNQFTLSSIGGTSTDTQRQLYNISPSSFTSTLLASYTSGASTGTVTASYSGTADWAASTVVLYLADAEPIFRSTGNNNWSGQNWERRNSDLTWESSTAIPTSPGSITVEGTSSYNNNANASTHTVTLPSNIQEGDLLLIFARAAGTNTITTPSGWSLLSSWGASGTTYVFQKTASANEGANVSLTSSASTLVSAVVYRISNWDNTVLPSLITTRNVNANDPPPAFGWGTNQSSLYIAISSSISASNATAAPTNYSNLTNAGTGSTITNPRVATARRVLSGLSDDPGPFTLGTVTNVHSATLAIKARPGSRAYIRNNHAVTVNSSQSADTVTVESGGVLMVNPSTTLTLANSNSGIQIQSGGALKLPETATIAGPGNFTLSSGAILEVGSTAGITSSGATGNVQNTGTRSFNSGANYIYNGTAAQVTGNGFPGANNLTINNSSGVTLSGSATVSGTLSLTTGIVTTGANTLTVGSSGSISGGSASSYVSGKLARVVANTASTFFPVGKGGSYKPLTFTSAAAASRTVTVEHFDSGTLLSVANTSRSRFGQGYWNINQSAIGTGYTVGLSPGSASPTGTVVMLRREGTESATSNATSFSSPYYSNSTVFSTGNASNDIMLAETSIPLTVSGATAANKEYDGNITATVSGGSLVGVVTPDEVTLTQAGTFNTKDVGTNKPITGNFSLGGADAGAYTLTQPTELTANITAKSLTISDPVISPKTYDKSAATGLITPGSLSGLVGTETLNVSAIGTFANANVGKDKPATVTYTLSDGNNGGIATNYSLAPGGGQGEITPIALTITGLAGVNKVYDGGTTASATGTPALSGVISEDDVTLSGTPVYTFASAGVGTGISISTTGFTLSGADAANYTLTQPTLSANITAKTLTISGLTGTSKPYDGNASASASGTATLSGIVGSDNVTLSGTPTFTFASAGVANGVSISTTGYSLSGTAADNYTLTQPTLSANITARTLTITGLAGINKVYDGNTSASATGSPSLVGVVSGETVTLGGTPVFTFASANVGTGIVITTTGYTLGGANASNYTLTQPSLTGNITPLGLTVTGLTGNDKEYDGNTLATSSGSAALSGVISGDAVTLSGTPSFTFASSGVDNDIPISTSGYTLSGDQAGNYTLTQPTLLANITPKTLTITGLTGNNKIYNGNRTATVTGTAALSGVVGSDDVSLTGTPTFTFASPNVGTGIGITTTGYALSGTAAGNYTLTQPSLSANITERELTISGLSGNTKVYDRTTTASATGTATLLGVLGGDIVTLSGSPEFTFASADVANGISITTSGYTLSGAQAGNYSLTQPTLSGNITPLGLTVTGLTGDHKVYDGTTAATASGTAALSGVISPDEVILSGTPTFTFATPDVANGISISTSGYTLTGAQAGNYSLTQPTLSANIIRKTLTVTGITGQNKPFDGNTTATVSGTPALSGVVSPDVVSLGGTPVYTFAQDSPGTGIAITASGFSISGADAGNYTLSQPSGLSADILKAASSVTVKPGTISSFTFITDTPQGPGLSDFTFTGSTGTKSILYSGTDGTSYSGTSPPTAIGNYTVTASVAADANYEAASSAPFAFVIVSQAVTTINPKPGTTGNFTYNGNAQGPTVADFDVSGSTATPTLSYTGTGATTYGPSATPPTDAGTYELIIEVAADDDFEAGSSQPFAFTIGRAPTVTAITISGAPFTYTGAALTPASVTVTGPAGLSFTPEPVYENNIEAGTATVSFSYAGDANYLPSSDTETFEIGKVSLTVTADAKSKEYGASDPALTYEITSGSLIGSDVLTGTLSRESGEDVGTYAITLGSLGNPNYAISLVSANLTITPRAISVAATAQTKVYGALDPALTYSITSGSLVSPDAFSGSLTRVAGENVGTYAISQGSLSLSSNYSLSFTGAALSITPRPITLTAAAKGKTYGNTDPALTYDITTGALIAGDMLMGTIARKEGEDVGVYSITQGTLDNSNYAITFEGADFTISSRAVTVRADDLSKTYGNPDPTLTYTLTSGSLAESESFSGALTRATGENVGDYEISQGTLALSSNYTLSFVPGEFTITPRALSVSADAQTKIYGEADPALTYQISGTLVPGDSFSGSLSRAAGETIGVYAITQGTLTLGGNYALSYSGANLTISKRAITLTAEAKSKVFGESDPALTYQISSGSLASGDQITGSLARAMGENVGDYQITQGTLSLPVDYQITYVSANLSITPASLTVTALPQSKTYGQTAPTSGTLGTNFTVIGLQGSDAVSGVTLDYSGDPAGNLATANVGSYTITPSALTLSTGSTSNYTITYTTSTLTVSPAVLTVTAEDKNKTYDGSGFTAFTATLTGFQNGETSSILSGTLSYEGTATTAVNAGTYTIIPVIAGLSAPNYTLSKVDGVLTIDRAVLTITARNQSKTYGQTAPTSGTLTTNFTVTGLLGSDAVTGVTLSYEGSPAGNLATASVGTYAISPSSAVFSSGSADNYTISYVSGTLAVNPASLTVAAVAKTKAFGSTLSTAGVLGTDFTVIGLQNSDAVSGATLSFSGSPAGNLSNAALGTYTITPSALVLSSGSSSNYTINYTTAVLTVVAGAPVKLVVSTIANQTAGAAFSVTVQAQDAGDNPSAVSEDIGVSLTLATGTASLGGTVSGTILSRTSSVTITGVSYTKAETINIQADQTSGSPSLTSAASNTFTVSPAGLSSFRIESFSGGNIPNQSLNQVFNIKITAIDQYGNTVPSFSGTGNTVTIASSPSNGFTSFTSQPFIDGVLSSSSVTFSNTGTFTITATRPSGGAQAGTSNSFGVGRNLYARVTSGNWNNTSSWSAASEGGTSCTCVPTSADNVYILTFNGRRTITIPSDYAAVAKNLYLGFDSSTGLKEQSLLQFSGSSSLTVEEDLEVYTSNDGGKPREIYLDAGTLTVGRDFKLTKASGSTLENTLLRISTGTANLNNVELNGSEANRANITFTGAGTLNISGNFSVILGTLTPSTGTVNFRGTAAQTIPIGVSSVIYGNLDINNTSSSGATLSAAVTAANVTGNIRVGNVTTGSRLNTNDRAVTLAASRTLTVAAGSILNAGSSTITFGASGTATINGTFITADTEGFSGTAGSAISSTNTPTINLGSNSTVEFSAASTQTLTVRSDYANLTLSGGSKTVGSGTLGVSGNLSIGSGATYNGSGNPTLNVGGNFTNNGNFTQGTELVTLNGTSAQTIGGSSSTAFGSLTLSNNSAPVSTSANITASGTLTVNSGAILVPGPLNTVGGIGSLTGSGTVRVTRLADSPDFVSQYPISTRNLSSLTVDYIGAGNQFINPLNYHNLLITANGARTVTLSGSGSIGVSGNFSPASLSTSYVSTGSTVEFNGTGAQTIPAFNYHHLISSSTGARTLASTGTIGVSGSFTPGSNAYTVTNSTVDFNGSSAQTIPAFTYHNLTSSSTGTRTLASSGTVWIAGTFTTGNNSYSTSGSTVNFNGSVAQTIPALNYHHLTSSSTGARTLASTGIIGVSGSFTPGSNAYTVTNSTVDFNGLENQTIPAFNYFNLGSSSSGARTLASTGIIGIAGEFTPGTNLYTVTGSTVNFNGTSPQILPSFTFTHLSFNGAGAKTLPESLTVNGDWTAHATLIPGTGRVTFSGSAQTLSGTATSSFYDLVWNGSSSLALAGNASVSNSLTVTTPSVTGSGTLDLNTNAVFNPGASGISFAAPINLGNAVRTFTVSDNASTTQDLAISGVISGSGGGITKEGAGSLTLSGTNTFTGGLTLNAGALNVNSNTALGTGTLTLNTGTIDNTSAGAVTLSATNPIVLNSDLTFFGTRDLNLGAGAITMAADRSITATANTLTLGGTLSAPTRSLTKLGAGTLALGSNAVDLTNLTISAGTINGASSTLSLSGNFVNNGTFTAGSGTLNISGNYENNGTFTPATGTVILTGASPQAIGGSVASHSFTNLTLNGAGLKTLGNPAQVSGTLTLSSGILAIGNHQLNTGTITGGTSSSYVRTNGTGRVVMTIPENASRSFLVGNSAYNPATIRNNSSLPKQLFLRVADESVDNSNNDSKTVGRKWYVYQSNVGSADLTFDIGFNAGEGNASFNAGSAPKLGLFSTFWTRYPATASAQGVTATVTASEFGSTDQYLALGSEDAFDATQLEVRMNPVNQFLGVNNTIVTVRSLNSQGVPTTVSTATPFSLSAANTKIHPSLPTGTIAAGAYQAFVNNIGFTQKTESVNATVTATVTDGEVLAPGVSPVFSVLAETIYEPTESGLWSSLLWRKSTDGGVTWTTGGYATLFPGGNIFSAVELIRIPAAYNTVLDFPISTFSMIVFGTLEVKDTGAITLNHTAGDLEDFNIHVHGVLKNSGGTITNTNTAFPIEIHGGTYIHAMDGGVIPVTRFYSLDEHLSTCEVTGVATTAISTGLNQTFQNFTWNNAGQAVVQNLNGNLLVQNSLHLLNGVITTTDAYYVQLGLGGTVTSSNGSRINGKLRRFIPNNATTVNFPIGDASVYSPVTLNFSGNVTGSGYVEANSKAIPPTQTEVFTGLNISRQKYLNRRWSLSAADVEGFTGYAASFQFVEEDIIGEESVPASFIVQQLAPSATSWTTPTVESPTSTGIQATGLTAFGEFAVGETCINGVWLGNKSSDWFDADNWCGGIPTATTDVLIVSTAPYFPVIDQSGAVAKNVTIQTGATLTIEDTNTFTVYGNWSNLGTFIENNSTVEFAGESTASIGVETFANVLISGTGVKSIAGNVTVSEVLTINASATLNAGSYTLNLTGSGTPFVRNGTFAAATSTVNYSNALATTVAAANYYNLELSGGNRTLPSSGTVGIANVFTPGAGTFIVDGSTVDFNGAEQSVPAFTYHNLSLSGSGAKSLPNSAFAVGGDFATLGSASATAGAGMSISGNVSIGSGTTFNAGSYTHTVGGNWSNSGTFNATGSTIEFNGTEAGSIGASNFNNITFSGSGAKTATGTLTIAGNLSITDNFTAGSFPHTVSGNWTNSGSFTSDEGTITFDGTVAQEIGGSATSAFHNLTLANTVAAVTTSADITASGNLTVNSDAAIIPGASNTVGGSGTLTGSGRVGVSRVASTPDFISQYPISNKTLADLTVDYTGAGAQTVNALDYSNLSISENGTRTVTLANTGTIGISGVFNPSTTNTTYTTTGSTVNFNGANQNVPVLVNYHNLTLSGSGTKTITGTLNVVEKWTMEGTAVASLGTNDHTSKLLYFGTAPQPSGSYGSTASVATNKNLTYFGNSGAGILTISCTQGIWTGAVSSDWFDPANWCGGVPTATTDVLIVSTALYQPSIGANGAVARNVTIQSTATLSIIGAYTFTVYGNWDNSGILIPHPESLIHFAGLGNTTISADNFAKVSFTGAGTTTLTGAITATGDITPVSTALVISGNNTLTLNAGKTMVITGSLTTPGTGKLILKPGAKYLNQSSSTPRLEVQQLIDGFRGWRMLGSPVEGATYSTFLSSLETQGYTGSNYPLLQPNVLWWDETDPGRTTQGWRKPVGGGQTVASGRGHYVFVFNGAPKIGSTGSDNYTDALPKTLATLGTELDLSTPFNFGVTFTSRSGGLTSETITIGSGETQTTKTNFTEGTEYNQGFNMIANPTPSYIDFFNGGWSKSKISETIYIWNPNFNVTVDGVTTQGRFELITEDTPASSRAIAPYQGFWVKATGTGPSLTMNAAAKIGAPELSASSALFYGRMQAQVASSTAPMLINLSVSGEGLKANSTIRISDEGEDGIDPWDGFQLESLNNTWLNLYSFGSLKETSPLAINHISMPQEGEKSIPLYLAAAKEGKPFSGNYTLEWNLPTNLPAGASLILMDHINKQAIDMSQTTSYAFSFDAPAATNARLRTADGYMKAPEAVVFAHEVKEGAGEHFRTSSGKVTRPFTIVISYTQDRLNPEYAPDQPKLFPPTPNPFGDRTQIKFYLPIEEEVEVKIQDLHGREVGRFPKASYKAGTHSLDWSPGAIDLAPGVYLIYAQIGDLILTQRAIKQ
ncbi:YDG domain-containing protein [Algoriphagus aquatilis]|uniref:YDG domain-containing protein n=1 Tax=Algoriphagus aquatilis TaxID=490186 RepID=A0ABW0BZU3_9BACT